MANATGSSGILHIEWIIFIALMSVVPNISYQNRGTNLHVSRKIWHMYTFMYLIAELLYDDILIK